MSKLTVIKHWDNIDSEEHVCNLVSAFVENCEQVVCFSPEDLDNRPRNVIGRIPPGKRVVVFTGAETYPELYLEQTINEILYHPYQGQDVICLIKDESPLLEKMAETYVDLCGFNSFTRRGMKKVPEVY